MAILIIVGDLEAVPKGVEDRLEESKIRARMETIQIIVWLKSKEFCRSMENG